MASAAGSVIVPEERRPQALATVFGGMTAAAVLGVPLATFLGDLIGWRWALVGIAGLTAAALVLVAVLMPPVEAFEGWAFFSQLYQAPQQARLVALLPEQRALLLALNASTRYVGVSVGGLLGSACITAVGARSLSLVGLVPLALAVLAQLASVRGTVTPAPVRTRSHTASTRSA